MAIKMGRKYLMKKTVIIFYISVIILFLNTRLIEAEENLTSLFNSIEPSVVVILTFDKDSKPIGFGSGFFINFRGDVVTNWHVIGSAYSAVIKTSDNKFFRVTNIVAADKEWDLICLGIQLNGARVRPLSISSTMPKVGADIIVIGAPRGLEKTISRGIVSALRGKDGSGNIIQIDAPLSPGSSGSPVLTMAGEVIGVVSFQISGENFLNFAVPGERILNMGSGTGGTQNSTGNNGGQLANVGQVADINGSYLTVELESAGDISVGAKAVVYNYGGQAIAEGYVNSVYSQKCSVEIQKNYGLSTPSVGMIVKFTKR